MKKGAFIWSIAIFAAFCLQTQISLIGFPMNLTVIAVYLFGLRCVLTRERLSPKGLPEVRSTAFGSVIGFIEDALSGLLIGPGFFAKGLTGFLCAVLFTDLVFRWTPLLGGMTLFCLSAADGLLSIVFRLLFTDIPVSLTHAFMIVLVQSVVNFVFGLILKPVNLA